MSIQVPHSAREFELLGKDDIRHRGYVEIGLTLAKPQVYLDIDLGISCASGARRAYPLTLRPGAERSRIIRVPADAQSIWIRPKRDALDYEIERLRVSKFPPPISLWIIQQRLKHFKRSTPLNPVRRWRAYNQTFNTRLGITNYQSWLRLREAKTLPKPTNTTDHARLNLVYFAHSEQPDTAVPSLPHSEDVRIFDLTQKDAKKVQTLREALEYNPAGRKEFFWCLYANDRVRWDALKMLPSNTPLPRDAIIYTDEDYLVGEHRVAPEFKPDWNPEYFFDSNYTGRAVIFGATHLREIDFTRFEPTLDAIGDLLAQSLKRNDDPPILHIPHICLHKGADRPAQRFGPIGQVVADTGKAGGNPSVDILIPTKDKLEVLRPCVDSILSKSTYNNYRVTVVDNGSSEAETLAYLDEVQAAPRVRVLAYPHPFNYSAINNFAAQQSDAEILILLNNDIEVITPTWIEELVAHAQKPENGCVGAKLYYPNGWIQHAGVVLGIGDIAGHGHRFYPGDDPGYMNRLESTQRISAVTAACLAIRKEIWDHVGGLDEKNLSVAYNDVDLCLKVKAAGYHNIWTPRAELIHYESLSRGQDNTPEKRRRYQAEVAFMKKKWGAQLAYDAYYHPALSQNREDFSLRS